MGAVVGDKSEVAVMTQEPTSRVPGSAVVSPNSKGCYSLRRRIERGRIGRPGEHRHDAQPGSSIGVGTRRHAALAGGSAVWGYAGHARLAGDVAVARNVPRYAGRGVQRAAGAAPRLPAAP